MRDELTPEQFVLNNKSETDVLKNKFIAEAFNYFYSNPSEPFSIDKYKAQYKKIVNSVEFGDVIQDRSKPSSQLEQKNETVNQRQDQSPTVNQRQRQEHPLQDKTEDILNITVQDERVLRLMKYENYTTMLRDQIAEIEKITNPTDNEKKELEKRREKLEVFNTEIDKIRNEILLKPISLPLILNHLDNLPQPSGPNRLFVKNAGGKDLSDALSNSIRDNANALYRLIKMNSTDNIANYLNKLIDEVDRLLDPAAIKQIQEMGAFKNANKSEDEIKKEIIGSYLFSITTKINTEVAFQDIYGKNAKDASGATLDQIKMSTEVARKTSSLITQVIQLYDTKSAEKQSKHQEHYSPIKP